VASTRNNASLVTHFAATKQLMTVRKGKPQEKASAGHAPQGPTPRRVAPSSSGAGSKKRKGKSERLKKRKAKEANKKAEADDGGFTMVNRSTARMMGIRVPVGDERTCLADALWVCLCAFLCNLQLQQRDVQMALMSADDDQDPSVAMANEYALQHGVQICFQRGLSSPVMLFRQLDGVFLVRLAISTEGGTDYHFVAYLAKHGFVIDNFPGKRVPARDDADRTNNQEAVKVFFKLFPGATQIQMTSVHQLVLMPEPPASPQFHKLSANHGKPSQRLAIFPLRAPRSWLSAHVGPVVLGVLPTDKSKEVVLNCKSTQLP